MNTGDRQILYDLHKENKENITKLYTEVVNLKLDIKGIKKDISFSAKIYGGLAGLLTATGVWLLHFIR